MLYYAPQTWVSDTTDAVERLKIQYGTSMVYPLGSMGCHVSTSPNQQIGRSTPLNTRANVAFFGSFGYEIDLMKCSPDELKLMSDQISFYKKYRTIFQKGIFTRLISPFEGEETAWQIQSRDGSIIILAYYRRLASANLSYKRLKLRSLEENAIYKVGNHTYSGSQLMNAGLSLPHGDHVGEERDFYSRLIVFERLPN